MTSLHLGNNSKVKIFQLLVACLALLAVSRVQAVTYGAEPLAAWVVDQESGSGIAGVNVVAAWELKGGLEGGNIVGYVNVMETVTDAEGKFSFPAWGPKERRGAGSVRTGAPTIILFKSGYSGGAVENERAPTRSDRMQSEWSGKKIRLPRFPGRPGTDQLTVDKLGILVDSLLRTDECNFKAVPRFLLAFEEERQLTLASRGIGRLPPLVSLSESFSSKRCGSLREYVMEHAK